MSSICYNLGIHGGYTNNFTHKRRYHRSPSAANLRRHKLRGSKDIRPKPYFETRIDKETGLGARNITTVEGGRAIFICRIRHLGHNRTVRFVFKIKFCFTYNSRCAFLKQYSLKGRNTFLSLYLYNYNTQAL